MSDAFSDGNECAESNEFIKEVAKKRADRNSSSSSRTIFPAKRRSLLIEDLTNRTEISGLTETPSSLTLRGENNDDASSGRGCDEGSRGASNTSSNLFLRRKSDISDEINAKIVKSSTDRKIKKAIQKSTQGFTINKLRLNEVGCYGRDKERAILAECLDRVALNNDSQNHIINGPAPIHFSHENKREIVFIGGISGTGKTTLAMTIRDTVESLGGAFVMGKFDHSSTQNVPYKGIADACLGICSRLMMEQDQDVKASILKKLQEDLTTDSGGGSSGDNGDNGVSRGNTDGTPLQLLLKIMPELRDFIGNDFIDTDANWRNKVGASNNQSEEKNPIAMNQQFNHVFRSFIRIICSNYRPLVMVIDDVQWCDPASLDLMEVLLTDRENSGLLMINCYRSNGVADESHHLSIFCAKLCEKSLEMGGFRVNEMELHNLGIDDTNLVVMALLSTDDPIRTKSLAEICHKRTNGNPLFLIFLLKILVQESFLEFNFGSLQWTWDINKIEEETTIPENMVESMLQKMNQLHHVFGSFLKIASVLGSTFSSHILQLLAKKLYDNIDEKQVFQILKEAVELSFIEPAGNGRFRWTHDKVQEAAKSLVPKSELLKFQFNIGLILLRNLDEKQLESMGFIVVNLLDSDKCMDDTIREEIAALSAKAANKAKELSAFDACLKYSKVGIRQLSDDLSWGTNYNLTLDLYCKAAESAGVSAQLDQLQEFCGEVLAHGRNVLDKMPVFYALALSKGRQGQFLEANKVCIDAIQQLGTVNFRRNGLYQMIGVFSHLFSTKKMLASLDAAKLPRMSDSKHIHTMKLLDVIASYAYESKNVILMIDACIKQAQLTVKYGISSSAPTALAQFGILVFGIFQDLAVGSRIADMSTSISHKLSGHGVSKALLAARTWGFMYSYSRPLHESLKQHSNGYSEGMKFGDTEMASWCLQNHASASFLQGKSLRTLNEDCKIYVPHIEDLGWIGISESCSYVWQAVLYLMGHRERDDTTMTLFQNLNGEVQFHEISRIMARIAAHTYSCEYEDGANFAIAVGNQYIKTAPGHMTCQGEVFGRAVCLYAIARKTKKRTFKKRARAVRKIIQGWAKSGSVNSKHHLCLLNAEDLALGIRQKYKEAVKLYQKGILVATKSGNLRDAGLISERCANFFLHDMKDLHQARYHVEESIRYFVDWGAQRTVDKLYSMYNNILYSSIPLSTLEITKSIPDLTPASNATGDKENVISSSLSSANPNGPSQVS